MKHMSITALSLAVVLSALEISASNVPCQCIFTGSEEPEPDCRVYGQLGGGNMIPFHRATQGCLDTFGIRGVDLPRATLLGMCPRVDAIDVDITEIAVELRFGSSSYGTTIKASYPRFFDVSGNLQSSIDGKSCEGNSNTNECWNVFQNFLFTNPSQVANICQRFHELNANDLLLEQRLARSQLCRATTATNPQCEPLLSQIRDLSQGQNPSCDAFGLGPAEFPIPDCNVQVVAPTPAPTPQVTNVVLDSLVLEDPCPCVYSLTPEDEADCRVYGQDLTPFYRASQKCLDAYSVKEVTVTKGLSTFYAMCPFPNATDANVQLIMNELRDEQTPAGEAAKKLLPQFFDDSGALKEGNILDTRGSPCTTTRLCYDIVRTFLVNNAAERGAVCQLFHGFHANDLELEQIKVRNQICNDEEQQPACEPLTAQIKDLQSNNPGQSCAAFAQSPTIAIVPGPSCLMTEEMSSSAPGHMSDTAVCLLLGMVVTLVGHIVYC